jgi:hypothetical protein
MLTCSVLHTREVPGSTGSTPIGTPTNIPISVMSTVSPGRYTVLPNVKYRPELGTAGEYENTPKLKAHH